MAIVLALCSALAYGVSDFLAGISSRGWDSRVVTFTTQAIGALVGVVAVAVDPGDGLNLTAFAWGALSGCGTAVGVLSLYRGFSHGSISVVAPVSGVLTTVIPAIVGLALGERLDGPELVGIALTLPAVALVSREPEVDGARSGGLREGILAGCGFGLLFVALDRAGGRHGAWPLLIDLLVSLVIVAPVAWGARAAGSRAGGSPAGAGGPSREAVRWGVVAGLLSGGSNFLFVLAAHRGQLAIVGVLSSLYPAGTVLMARVWLHERWSRVQITGMLTAIVAVVLVAVG